MNSEIEKDPSGIEIPRTDDGYALPKFDSDEMLTDQNEFPESGETLPLTDFVPGSTDNNNQTSGARAQCSFKILVLDLVLLRATAFTCSQEHWREALCLQGSWKIIHSKHTDKLIQVAWSWSETPSLQHLRGKGFADKSALVRHKLIYSEEKPFGCRICMKAFADRSVLVISGSHAHHFLLQVFCAIFDR
ncbi:unnamed protein product [Cyprideis torosa]|uniref:Uncharacterized protein n=1 Tax=Cyprideis torosa TaxID=163714 RepID=A0A7R8WQM9_9CRUS|nr:unnamed protein product [Cyprideis torosa]CAG0901925.1 unnamed protein product [Cyprideis torosa]